MAHNEQIFTPYWIADIILDKIGYVGTNIRKKHIIDNSCGEGIFLSRIVERYVNYCRSINVSFEDIQKEVKEYIHGIEIDKIVFFKCKMNYSWSYKYEGYCMQPDLINGNALTNNDFNNKMDFVVGNPPYCKIHDMDEEKRTIVKSFKFTQDSNTDLYLAFFEKGIEMLNEQGVLGYITPNSWLTSKAAQEMRNYFYTTKKLAYILQFGNEKVFYNATTYTCITVVVNNKKENWFNCQLCKDCSFDNLTLDDIFINGNFYLGKIKQLNNLRQILESNIKDVKVKVKNGFATLNDKLFIDKDGKLRENYIPVVKASTGQSHTCFFPYDKEGKPLKINEINEQTLVYFETMANYFGIDTINNPNWYLFGRSQAINDVYKEKITISNLIKDEQSLKLNRVPTGTGVYGGLYIVSNTEDKINVEKIYKILNQKDFIENYVKLLGKYKNGDYYTFSSVDLEKYLNYYLNLIIFND